MLHSPFEMLYFTYLIQRVSALHAVQLMVLGISMESFLSH